MSKLAQLLSYLKRDDIHALVFRSGDPILLEAKHSTVAVTKVPLTLAHVRGFFVGTPIADRLPATDRPPVTDTIELWGHSYHITIGHQHHVLQVRIESAPDRPGTTTTPTVRLKPSPSISPTPLDPSPPKQPSRPASSSTTVDSKPSIHDDHARLRTLLATGRQHRATDVHIASAEPVRFRCAQDLVPHGPSLDSTDVDAMLRPLLEPHIATFERQGYIDMSLELEDTGRWRVNISRQRTGLKLCARTIASQPPTIEQLGLPSEVQRLEHMHQGLVVICGPNGHGKTTTMAALVDMFNRNHAMHIITVEDPVEILHPRKRAVMSQREVGTHTQSFQRALKAALREDPDVIAIGELRDRETVEMALSAAETGHLVFATMSTPSAAKSIDRMIELFPPDDQAQVRATMAGALKLLLCQRLLRACEPGQLVAAFEMVTGNVPLWALIRDQKLYQLPSLMQRGRNYGMLRLDESLKQLVDEQRTTREEARLYAENPRLFASAPSSPALDQAGALFAPRGSHT